MRVPGHPMLRLMLLCALLAPVGLAADPLQERLRDHLELLQVPDAPEAATTPLLANRDLRGLYDSRGYRPLWSGSPSARASLEALPQLIQSAEAEGLQPADYHLERLQQLLGRIRQSASATIDTGLQLELELLATDALLTLAHHFRHGKVDPASVDPRWFLPQGAHRDQGPLLAAIADGPEALKTALQARLPAAAGYQKLRERLALQRTLLEQPWPALEAGPALRPGQQDPCIGLLRERLLLLGDLAAELPLPDAADHYDAELEAAVRRFQARHGQEADAIVGPQTRAQLNMTPAQRIEQIRVNMARWRWLPRDLGDEHIVVNIAGFWMRVMHAGEEVMRQRVIVGRPYRQTPVFSGRMTYLVLNPSWEVPSSIARRDLLPQFRADPDHVDRMGFQVLQGWGADERRIDHTDIDWHAVSPERFPYRIRQAPGPANALGMAKFMFPNQHAVYLHDTPARGLFALEERAFSSGCIRIADPLALTEWLLSGDGRPQVMGPARISEVLASGRETTVRLSRPIDVHLLYWTAWVETDGSVHYRRDLYERDGRLLAALDAPPPRHNAWN